jgi:crotonobetainyl-CoA:carnitine CoA-transferase CaiB-like acyl-CoA transferase
VTAALFRRATTGEISEIDASLLAAGLWQIQPDVVNAKLDDGEPPLRRPDRHRLRNPLMATYRTADGRFVALTMVAPDPHWPDLCRRLGDPDLGHDPRFVDADARWANAEACVETLDRLFAEHSLAGWRRRLAGFSGEWAVVQTPAEVHDDPQVQANGYVAPVDMGNDVWLPMVTAPAQFDGRPSQPGRAPELGEHTEAVLLDLGLDWDELAVLKESHTIT